MTLPVPCEIRARHDLASIVARDLLEKPLELPMAIDGRVKSRSLRPLADLLERSLPLRSELARKTLRSPRL
jgi:hypothetical protein